VRARAVRLLSENRLFSLALAAGTALRLVTMLAFPPAIWYGGDSVSYVNSGLHWWPGVSRESGYGVFLEILHPFHSFALVTLIQHLAGLAMGVLVYALLRHRYRLPGWGATLAALPVLIDPYVIQLEQEILADSIFTFLCVTAVVLVLWWPDRDRPAWSLPAAAALFGIASAFWPVGLPLLIVLLVYMIIRWVGWQKLVATAVAGAVPLLAYAGWFDLRYHHLGFNTSDGVFLWSRTMTFANCQVIKPPADLRPLCPSTPVSDRQESPFYIWEAHSPLLRVGGTGGTQFTATRNTLARKFAIKAIEAQPLDYAGAVLHSWLITFSWDRPQVPSHAMAIRYQFTDATQSLNALGGGQGTAAALVRVQNAYTGGHGAATREVQPFADIMIGYQRYIYLRGTMLGVLMLAGLGGIVVSWRGGGWRRRRDWGGPALFPWVAALTMEVVPPATADFSLRYVVPTIPVICIATALAFARPLRGEAPVLADQGPAGQIPADQLPADQLPADHGPADQGPADHGPAEEAAAGAVTSGPAESTGQAGTA
jgi:hypothetical protein